MTHHGKAHRAPYTVALWAIVIAFAGAIAATAIYIASRHNIAGGVTAIVGISLGSILSRLVGVIARRRTVILLWHETIRVDRLQRRLVGIFTEIGTMELARAEVTRLPGFSLAPESFLIVDIDVDPLSRPERIRLTLKNRRRKEPVGELEAATIYMVWDALDTSYILRGDQGYVGVGTTLDVANILLRRAAARDSQTGRRIEPVRVDAMLWPFGYSEFASPVRPLILET